ncbi:hypothetical protein N2152v2_011221 [Parachlorella kessleri]
MGIGLPPLLGTITGGEAWPPPQQQHLQPSEELQAKVASLLEQAAQLDTREAASLLKQGLINLQRDEGSAGFMPSLLVRQYLSLMLFTAGSYAEAVDEARQVYEAICRVVGEGSSQAVLFGMRLGILEAGGLPGLLSPAAAPAVCSCRARYPQLLRLLCAAAGDLESGSQRIFDAGAMAAPNLDGAIARAYELKGQGAPGGEVAEADAYVRKLMSCLAESAFYYTLFAVQQMAQAGETDEVLGGWEKLERNMVQGMTDMVAVIGADTSSVKNALREHRRVALLLEGNPKLGRRMVEQGARLQQLADSAGQRLPPWADPYLP